MFAHNRIMREKEVLRQDDTLVRKLKAITSTIDNRGPRSQSVGRLGKTKRLVQDKQEEIGKHNMILLRKLKDINDRPNRCKA